MSQVAVICAVIGPDRARDDLLPYLLSKQGEFDQVTLAMAKSMEHFLPHIGGAEHACELIPLFEMLCRAEETVVRTAAAKSCCVIISQLGKDVSQHLCSAFYVLSISFISFISIIFLHHFSPICRRFLVVSQHPNVKEYINMLNRLIGEEEVVEEFYSRVSASILVPTLYKSLSSGEDLNNIQTIYGRLLRDEMHIVRRGAVAVFSEMFSIASPPVQIEWFIPLLKEISVDDDDAVKVIAIEGYETITESLHASGSSALLVSELVPLIKAAAGDESWRVRFAVAKMYGGLVSRVPADVCKTELFHGAVKLLMDNETDIRVIMCDNLLPYFSAVGGETFLLEVVPILQLLAEDTVVNVRKACADMIVKLATKSANESNAQQVNELVAKIMDDEDPLVRLRLIRNLALIAEELPTLCNQLTTTLKSHFQDKNWRVRKHLIEAMPAILRQMGQEFFTENYIMDFLPSLGDEVEEVRNSAANALPLLVHASTPLWIQETVFPTVRQLSTEGDFIHRISFLNALRALMEVELPESFQTEVITLMIASSNDGVPNVRLRAAQVLGFTASKLGVEGSRTQIRPVLNELAQDKDRDVQYFATEALKTC